MKVKLYLFLCALLCIFWSGSNVLAQKPVKTTLPPAATYKKPLVKTFLGKVSGITTLPADEARKLITLPLKIVDDKNIVYTLSSYQFAYKRLGVTEDEQTGKILPQSDIAADRFTKTPLPEVWLTNIIHRLHKGEELYFFDVIVIDNKDHRFFAPELKITID